MNFYFSAAVIAYLLGSIPFGFILVRVFRGEDVRRSGSGNIGATNVARSAPGLGVLTLALDAAKGFLAVWAGIVLGYISIGRAPASLFGFSGAAPARFAALAAICAILGHMFPVWLKFRGGKGVATSVGVFVAIAPKAVVVALLIFAVIVAAFRYVSLGSILAVAAFPVLAYAFNDYHSSAAVLAAMAAAAVLIIGKHHGNVRRLLAGTEHRFAWKRTGA